MLSVVAIVISGVAFYDTKEKTNAAQALAPVVQNLKFDETQYTETTFTGEEKKINLNNLKMEVRSRSIVDVYIIVSYISENDVPLVNISPNKALQEKLASQ